MRSLYFTAAESGMTRAQLRHGEAKGRWIRLGRGSYRYGPEPATGLDACLGPVAATDAITCDHLAGVLHGFDGVTLAGPEFIAPVGTSNARPGSRRRTLLDEPVTIAGFRVTSPLETLFHLAELVDDVVWEQALESALRKDLVTIADIEARLASLADRRAPGLPRIRRVLALRPPGAPPTGSLLETRFLQLRRRVPGSGEPCRQVEVRNEHGEFVAFVDFAWPALGLFIELDGQQHAGQPVYDARRETAVVAATGWLVGRFTWDEVTRHPTATARRLEAILRQAAARPLH